MNAVVNRYPCSSPQGQLYCITSRIRDRPNDVAVHFPNVKMAIQLCQSTHSGPHGQNRASLMNPMYSIARTRQCPRKSCSPRQPMAAYMWNGLQPVTSFTLIPNPNQVGEQIQMTTNTMIKGESTKFGACSLPLSIVLMYLNPNPKPRCPHPNPNHNS